MARDIGVGRQPATARVPPVDVVLHDDLPETLSLDESYRAAFYFVLGYLSLEKQRSEDLTLFSIYMWTGALGRLISVRFVVDWQTVGWRILTMKGSGRLVPTRRP